MNDNIRRRFHWSTFGSLTCALAALILGLIAFKREGEFEKRVERRFREQDWTMRLLASTNSDSVVYTTVGIIQFIKRGFSIELTNVSYTGEGLHLTGFVGNPTRLSLHGLALTFTASKRILSPTKEDFLKGLPGKPYTDLPAGLVTTLYHEQIGHAESAPIDVLLPGLRAPFEVTVPNVKQAADGFRLEVAFSGAERYSY